MKIAYLDLFSGCGGFRLGLQRAGFEFSWEGHSEIDRQAKKKYREHFPASEDLGDVRTISGSKLPELDLITFGFPCQDLSVAGDGKGLDGARSGLFFEAVRLIQECRPKAFVFENVKGLLTNRWGQDWKTVLRTIADLGVYDCEWQLLNTLWFLPQNRERVYFVGHLAGSGGFQVFPIGEGDGLHRGKSRTKKAVNTIRPGNRSVSGNGETYIAQHVNCIDANYYKGIDGHGQRSMIQINPGESDAYRVYDSVGLARTLKATGGGVGAKTGLYQVKRTPLKFLGRNQKNIEGDYAYTVDTTGTGGVSIGAQVRRLTPIECARLQGFPDDWLAGLSDSAQYRIYGNAVSVPVVQAVAERLKL